jgi:quercetin dioxygenase-like cupin family protein
LILLNILPEYFMQYWPNGSRSSSKGPSDWFTGAVRMDPLHQAQAPARANAVSLSFEPGARTAWHTHPLGQVIIITSGQGLAQTWGGAVQTLNPGDVVWFAPGEKHWHGATGSSAMAHIAIQEGLDGVTVEWLEQVTDADYVRGS